MSRVIPSAEQKKKRSKFAEAQAAEKKFLADPVRKAYYKSRRKPGRRPHGLFISEWMALHKGVAVCNQLYHCLINSCWIVCI